MGDWLSVLGLYTIDNRLFSSMALPNGVDRETVRDNILLETAELETLYTDAEFFKFALKTWSKKRLPTWERIYKALLIEYDPIENYRRTEQYGETFEDNGTANSNNNENETRTPDLEKTETLTPNETDIISRTGFNSGDWQGTEKQDRTGTTTNVTQEQGNEEYKREGEQHSNSHNKRDHTGQNITFGNIGTTSSQMMLEQEFRIAETNIIELIVSDFKEAFCIMVY